MGKRSRFIVDSRVVFSPLIRPDVHIIEVRCGAGRQGGVIAVPVITRGVKGDADGQEGAPALSLAKRP